MVPVDQKNKTTYEGCSKINVTWVLSRENRAILTQNHIESIACSLERGMCQYLAHNYTDLVTVYIVL